MVWAPRKTTSPCVSWTSPERRSGVPASALMCSQAGSSSSFTQLVVNREGISDKVYMEHPAGATYYDEAEDVKPYQENFDRLAGSALDAELTTGILDEALKALG